MCSYFDTIHSFFSLHYWLWEMHPRIFRTEMYVIIVSPIYHISHSCVENCCGFDRGQRLIIASLLQSFYRKKWQTDSFICWDFCTLVTTQVNWWINCEKEKLIWKLNDACSRQYSPTEHLAVIEVIVLFKCRVREYTKKHKWFGMKIWHTYDSKRCTYNMTVYWGKDRKCVAVRVAVTHTSMIELTARIENVGNNLFMENYMTIYLPRP